MMNESGAALFQNNPLSPAMMNRPKETKAVDYQPTNTDVLCGRGSCYFHHEGNERFRDLVQASLESYTLCKSRMEKSKMVFTIVAEIRGMGGHFLRKDTKSDRWYDIGDKLAREKVGHALRDTTVDGEYHKKKRRPSKKLQRPQEVCSDDSRNSSTTPTTAKLSLKKEMQDDAREQTSVTSVPFSSLKSCQEGNLLSTTESHCHQQDPLEPLSLWVQEPLLADWSMKKLPSAEGNLLEKLLVLPLLEVAEDVNEVESYVGPTDAAKFFELSRDQEHSSCY